MFFELDKKDAGTADADLVKRSLGGDEAAFCELMGRHQGLVRRTVYRRLGRSSERDDAVQEVFMRSYVSLHTFDRSFSFRGWIGRIATNYCIDQLRRKRLHLRILHHMEGIDRRQMHGAITCCQNLGCINPYASEQYIKFLRVTLEELNPKYKTAFVLREMEDREYCEVAQVLGVSEAAARVRVSRARKKMRKRLRENFSIR
jgi:RNA polymerase sigma-70 factor (ECF subfamily)